MVIPLAAGRRRRKVALQKHLYFPSFTPTEVNPRDSLPVAVSPLSWPPGNGFCVPRQLCEPRRVAAGDRVSAGGRAA